MSESRLNPHPKEGAGLEIVGSRVISLERRRVSCVGRRYESRPGREGDYHQPVLKVEVLSVAVSFIIEGLRPILY